jgi:hypothetical protein
VTDIEQLSALLKARGIGFTIEYDDHYGKLLRVAPKTPPDWNKDITDGAFREMIEHHDGLAGYDHFYAVLQFDDEGKLVHIGAYE